MDTAGTTTSSLDGDGRDRGRDRHRHPPASHSYSVALAAHSAQQIFMISIFLLGGLDVAPTNAACTLTRG